jgi:hypothetical protein
MDEVDNSEIVEPGTELFQVLMSPISPTENKGVLSPPGNLTS